MARPRQEDSPTAPPAAPAPDPGVQNALTVLGSRLDQLELAFEEFRAEVVKAINLPRP